jgi:hypothetical protein
MTFVDWNPDWDDGNDKADGTEESKDTDSDIGGTEETKQDEASTVNNTVAAAPVVNAHTADKAASNGSGSPPLLSTHLCPSLLWSKLLPHQVISSLIVAPPLTTRLKHHGCQRCPSGIFPRQMTTPWPHYIRPYLLI